LGVNVRLLIPAAVIIALAAVALFLFLAAIGFQAAFAILVVTFAIIAFIIVGGQVR
jgi:hypothetical protein